MAGSYPDAIGPRLPYDRDGTVGILYNTGNGTLTQLTQAQMTGINDESSSGSTMGMSGGGSQYYAGFIFPTLTDFMGYFILTTGNGSTWSNAAIQTSPDTTNLMDGTWTQIAASQTVNNTASPNYRTNQVALNASAIKGIRFRYTSGAGAIGYGWAAMNLFGKPTNTTDRLELWHPTLDQPLSQTPAYFDFGDVSRGSGALTRDFRIKNLSTSLTASNITVGVEAPTDASPTYVSQTQFSYNGSAYASTQTLSTLGPSSLSQTFSVQLNTLSTAALGPWAQRYYAQAGSWS